MSKTVWHKGPPPSIGWWPASNRRLRALIRWWNGEWWSVACFEGDHPDSVAKDARIKDPDQDLIEWTERPDDWPERSRT